ncbi:MAG: hypothetical protein R3E54_02255 [Halioglobus sp.]
MMLRPRILLLDEPFAAVDPVTRLDIHEQLLLLHAREPTTVILVTHDMREALRLAQNIVVMDQGRILRHCESEQLLAGAGADQPERLLLSMLSGAPA